MEWPERKPEEYFSNLHKKSRKEFDREYLNIPIKREKKCDLTFIAGKQRITIKAFQSPRAIRIEHKRPDIVVIDCYQEYDKLQLLRLSRYFEEIAHAMEIK